MFDVPNLDDMSVDPNDYIDAEAVLKQLAAYCSLKQRAMRARLSGAVEVAVAWEQQMEAIYKRLPEWARW